MRIGYLTTSLSSHDGWGRYSKSLIESVAKHASVIALTWRGGENESKEIAAHPVLPPSGFSLVTQIGAFFSCMRYFRDVDVIHSLVETYAPGAALAALLMRKTFVMTLHGTYSIPPRGFGRHSIFLRFAYKVAAHTTTGSFGTEEKVGEAGVKLKGCRFIPNGVDEITFHHDHLPREDFFMTVGEIKPRKGADLGVRALALLKDEFPKLQYRIVGNYAENRFVEEIHEIARAEGIEDRVIFTGRIDDTELVSMYNRCRAFLLAARNADGSFEGFPMVYYEANRCGAPVITTTGFGSEYAIKPGVNGFLVPPEGTKEIADTLRSILTDPALPQKLTEGALSESGKHTWDQISPKLIAFYEDARNGITN
ncbi:MAG: hypothetical protein JWL88_410 [Parcubacteria group bacterium]|nr:hypothetical protein [Parcubacteria group bacterium]